MKKIIHLRNVALIVACLAVSSAFAQGGTTIVSSDTYEITVLASPPEGGDVYGGGTYAYGDIVTVGAISDPCYSFFGWEEGGVLFFFDSNYTFEVTESRVLTAHFEVMYYDVIAYTDPPEGGIVTGSGIYDCGTVAAFEAIPAECWEFLYWREPYNPTTPISYDNPYEFEVTEDRILIAHFDIKIHDIIVSANPPEGGAVQGNGNYICGDIVTVEAVANEDYVFVNWTENGVPVSNNNVFAFTAEEDRTLVANFEGETYYEITVSANPPEAGTVIGGGSYFYGETVTVSTTTNTGYDFVNWLADGVEVSTDVEYTFIVTENLTLIANFEMYMVTVAANPPDCGGVSGGGTFRPGIEVTVSAIAKSGSYEFVNWTKGGVEVSTDVFYTFITEIGDMELVANFEKGDVGIVETDNYPSLQIYPNPVNYELKITNYEGGEVQIYDLIGQKLLSFPSLPSPETTLDVSHLPAGMYFIKIGDRTAKFVKE